MYCSRCGGELAPDTAFCRTCGTPVSAVVERPDVLKRPTLITVLAVLQLVSAAIWLLVALAMTVAALSSSSRDPGAPGIIVVALLLGAVGVAQLLCGMGLLQLKPHGRTLQLVFAWIGLLGIPIGTIISIFILVYMYKPGIKALFSGKHVSEFSAEELAQIAEVTRGSGGSIVMVVVLVAIAVIVLSGIFATIAVPGLLRARVSGNEASAIGSLRAINSAEATYSAVCAAGGYAVALDDLAKPPRGGGLGFILSDLGTNGVTKSGYRVRLAKDASAGVSDVATAAATCNASARTRQALISRAPSP